MEEALRGGLCPVGTVAEFRRIQVDLQNPPLWPAGFDQKREIRLQSFAKIAAAGPQKKVLGDLLTDGAGAVHSMAVLIEFVGLFDGLHVETPVLGKLLILRGNDSQRQVRRNPVQIRPAMAHYVGRITL